MLKSETGLLDAALGLPGGIRQPELIGHIEEHDSKLGGDEVLHPVTVAAGALGLLLLQLCHLALQESIDAWQIVSPDVCEQHGVDAVQVPHQLPEAGLAIRATVHQDVKTIDSKEGRVPTTTGKDVTARLRELEEAS